jgi:hypothetical protein
VYVKSENKKAKTYISTVQRKDKEDKKTREGINCGPHRQNLQSSGGLRTPDQETLESTNFLEMLIVTRLEKHFAASNKGQICYAVFIKARICYTN